MEAASSQKEEGGTFTCSRCGLEEHYDYKGQKPLFSRKIVFLEDSYVMKDPFSPPNKHQFLLLGSDCVLCHKSVCQSQDCSLFYSKRFCRPCAELNIDQFPTPVQNRLRKNSTIGK